MFACILLPWKWPPFGLSLCTKMVAMAVAKLLWQSIHDKNVKIDSISFKV